MGYFDKSFINSGKFIPVVSRYVFFEKNAQCAEKVYTINNYSLARTSCPEEIIFKRTIILSGAGKSGRRLLELNPTDIAFVIDSNKDLEGTKINWKAVRHPDTIDNWKDYFILIAGPKEIEDNLNKRGMVKAIDYYVVG